MLCILRLFSSMFFLKYFFLLLFILMGWLIFLLHKQINIRASHKITIALKYLHIPYYYLKLQNTNSSTLHQKKLHYDLSVFEKNCTINTNLWTIEIKNYTIPRVIIFVFNHLCAMALTGVHFFLRYLVVSVISHSPEGTISGNITVKMLCLALLSNFSRTR